MKKNRVKRFFDRYIWSKVHRQYKDRLFRFLFEKDKRALLELYNALNGTAYEDESRLQIVTMENAIYMEMKNDVAFVLEGVLNLYEHQSTYNPNMPIRFLMYLAQEYNKIVEQAQASLFGTKMVMLPTPQCVVFYNGTKEMPEDHILRLSDAFENKEKRASVELEVRMLNINSGHNQAIMSQCRMLKEYAEFVEVVRTYMSKSYDVKVALNVAVDYCIEHGILSKELRQYRAEVLEMMLGRFDKKKYERSLREEGREEGISWGEERKLVEMVCKKMKRGKVPEIIAEELEEDIEVISSICETVQEVEDNDVDRILLSYKIKNGYKEEKNYGI